MPGLSERETQFLEQVAKGLQDKEIAARFGLHPKTVSNTLSSAYRKMNVSNRRDAVRHFLGSDYPREAVPIPETIDAFHDQGAPTPSGEALGHDLRTQANPAFQGVRFGHPPRVGGTLLPVILMWTLVGSIVLTIVFGLFVTYHLASKPVAEQAISSKDPS